jgi:hypothetical protein
MTKTDPKNDPNISRTLLIACWGNVRLIAVIAVIPVLVRNQSIISGNIDFSYLFSLTSFAITGITRITAIRVIAATCGD